MKNKIITILISILIITSLKVIAGDINNPEITDDQDDFFGSFIEHPFRYQLFHLIGLLPMENFDFLDIESAWFYEEEENPEYLFASLKLKDLEIISQRAIYTLHWKFNDVKYAVGSHIFNNGLNIGCMVGYDRHLSILCNFKEAEVIYDFDNDIVTFKFKKEDAGNLEKGDILTNTYAWTALRFNFEPITILFSNGELIKDAAPFIESNNDYGLEYIIQY
jgi:hypothetical protein